MRENKTTSAAADTIPGFTDFLDKLTEAFKDIPQPPIFASSILFPSDSAWSFKHEDRDYMLAAPLFWQKVPMAVVETDSPFVLGGIAIIDIDHPRERRMRAIVLRALVDAMSSARAA